MRITYLSFAIQALAEIRTYLSINPPSMAQQAEKKLKESLNALATFPNLGKPCRVFGTRELAILKVGKFSYIAIYRVQKESIQILRVLARMRDIDSILSESFEELGED